MNTRFAAIDAPERVNENAKPSLIDRFARRLVLSRLEHLQFGQIVVTEKGERTTFGHLTDAFPISAQLTVNNPGFYSDMATDDLTTLLRILLRNRDVLERIDSGMARLSRPLRKVLHALNRNTRKGSRKNIAAHYDLGNDFYQLWLDPTMMYSAACFETPATPLEEASINKLDRICRKLDLSDGDSVMEIGTGWGGFAIHAAKHYGCHVTTTTISKQQHDYARQAIADAGLEDKITLLLQDYRDLEGHFDKLVSENAAIC